MIRWWSSCRCESCQTRWNPYPALPLTLVKEITVIQCRDYKSIAPLVPCRRLSRESPCLTNEVKTSWGYRHPYPTIQTCQALDATWTILSGFVHGCGVRRMLL